MTTADSFIDALEHELVSAIGRRRRLARKRVGAVAGAIGVVAIVGITLLIGLPGSSPSAALALSSGTGSVTVRVTDATADPARMTAQLGAAGIDAHVSAEPVQEGDVGHWIAMGTLGPQSDPSATMSLVRDLADQIRSHPDFLTIPKGMPATILLVVGRPAAAGEQPCTGDGQTIITPGGRSCPSSP